MRAYIVTSLFAVLLTLSAQAELKSSNDEASVKLFNQAAESWKELQSELDALPAGHLKQAAHLAEYADRMHDILMKMHDATAGLPVSETTKVCLDYALHKGCDLSTCTAECCQQATAEKRDISPKEIDAMVVQSQKDACECNLPIRLAIRHDLLKAGVSDRKTLDMILMIPEDTDYQGVSEIDWKQATSGARQE
jgi:hypothetical protein